MGILVRYLSEIPKEYSLYGVFIADPFGTVAERVIAEDFEKIALEVGSGNIVAKVLTWEGRAQAEKKFKVKATDLRPVLVITDVHPEKWTPDAPMIKIQLGKIKTDEAAKGFLSQLTRWLPTEDLGMIRWELKLQQLKKLIPDWPAIVELIAAAK